MRYYGTESMMFLASVKPDLRQIFTLAINDVDLKILCGRRRKIEQNYLYQTHASKVQWPHSKHNVERVDDLAEAIDYAPWPIDWNDAELFRNVSHYLRGIGKGIGVELRLGSDWDRDFLQRDQRFHDLGHVELWAPAREAE